MRSLTRSTNNSRSEAENDMKSSHKAIEGVIAAVAEIADIVRELDPGKVAAYDRIEKYLEDARGKLIHAKAFERQ